MTIEIFIDDSGKNDPPVFVLGGVIGRQEGWSAFADDWAMVLATHPAIPHLKMKDANARRGAFKGMSTEDRDAKLVALAAVIRKHALATISVTVRHEEYRQIFEGRMMRWMDRPYQMLFHLIIATTYKLRNELGLTHRASFVFDRQLEHEAALRESFVAMKKNMQPDLEAFLADDPRHADDKDELPLQAADMVAWHVRRSWKDCVSALRAASAAGPILADLPGKHDLFNAETLQFLAGVATKTVRDLNTVFPYEADRIAETFDTAATCANLHLMADAWPLQPVELISFPAIGTAKYLLVNSCAEFCSPHLHKRLENRCLGAASVA
ncbi:hypothetical protein M2337_001726 [Sphingobium sp. B2D3A]|uniref:DUF3800 domain-containing protein n=1 Tax=unclassified Sphingobium TaxID=2611147 RepID=UPI00222550BE|nr:MULTISPECIES: DUF3800 domain-containing protein [unclassified Sphingobium]MCW2337493.1 hypothetical protein [Sphingobium sp. B2D3A]MCW2383951.1 hypothetical protein [Sphingobium sp. B2D3D]